MRAAIFLSLVATMAHANFDLDGINCLRLMAQAARGPWAASDLRYAYTPIIGRNLSGKMAEVMRVADLLPTILDHAIETISLTDRERALLTRMRFTVEHEDRLQNLQFVSAERQPEIFAAAGPHRIAVTGDRVGSPVYIDADRLGELDLEATVALLVHEYAHHHGERDEPARFLDNLGERVARSLKIEAHHLAAIGLPHFTYSTMEIYPAQTRAETAEDAYGAGVMPQHDLGFGTHLILSDGVDYQDVREIVRAQFSHDAMLLHVAIVPRGWRIEENKVYNGVALGRVLVVPLDLHFGLVKNHRQRGQLILPITEIDGVVRFRQNDRVGDVELRPFVADPTYERQNLQRWAYRDLGWGVDASAVGEDVKVIRDRQGVRVEFYLRPDDPENYLRYPFRAQLQLIWTQEFALPDGKVTRTLLPTRHALNQFMANAYRVEPAGEGRFKVTTEPRFVDLATSHLRLTNILMHPPGGVQTLLVVPETMESLETRGPEPMLTSLGAAKELPPQTWSLKKDATRELTLEFAVPRDFPLEEASDISEFSGASGDVKVLLEKPDESLHRGMGPGLLAEQAFRFTVGRAADAAIFERDGQRFVRLPLQSEMSNLLKSDFGWNSPVATYGAPPVLRIKGFILQTESRRAWHVESPVEIRFTP